jgi:hypothetical protein
VFAGHAKEILNGPLDVPLTNSVNLTSEAIKMLGAKWLSCANRVGEGRGYHKGSARIDDDWKIIVFAGEIQGG